MVQNNVEVAVHIGPLRHHRTDVVVGDTWGQTKGNSNRSEAARARGGGGTKPHMRCEHQLQQRMGTHDAARGYAGMQVVDGGSSPIKKRERGGKG